MATPNQKVFPWGLHPLEPWIRTELNNRAKEYGMNPGPDHGKPYAGPRSAWTRVFSNGISSKAPNLEGFVMGGTQGFNDSYGFNKSGLVTLGVDANGHPHTLTATDFVVDGKKQGLGDFPHRPPPSITSVETEFQGGANSSFGALCRKTKISWKCYSLSQLEYLTPYFLTPRISVLVEWGWNNYENSSLVDLSDIDWLYGIFMGDPDFTSLWVEQSNGNYDLAMGFITDYGYNMNEVGGYDCFTTITNANYLIEGQSYQNAKTEGKAEGSDSGSPKESVQMKDFKEFVFDDMENLNDEKKRHAAAKAAAALHLYPKNRIFSPESDKHDQSANSSGESWLRMDLVVEIINKFFAIQFVDKDGKNTGTEACRLDIKDVPICAHPAMKSAKEAILIPNQFAPRFVNRDSDHPEMGRSKTLRSVTTVGTAAIPPSAPNGAYFALFPDVLKTIRDFKFDDSYDDLKSIINSKAEGGNSFPVFSDYTGTKNIGAVRAGYWGYLQDIFVSVSLLKDLVEKNDTALKLIEELLQQISEATCNICQLKVIPDTNGNQRFSVVDMNFSTVNTATEAAKLERISLGSVDTAYVRTADFGVKLSPEMSNQMVMQSASGKGNTNLPNGAGTIITDPKKMGFSRFAAGDRMFDRGFIPDTTKSTNASPPNDERAKFKRYFDENGQSNFLTYKKGSGDNVEVFILCEKDSSFLKAVLLDMKNQHAVYTNNPIMPGTEINIELLGIGGITFLSQFTLDHVPDSYSYQRAVWQVSNVKQKVENNMWTTTITAQARPLTILAT